MVAVVTLLVMVSVVRGTPHPITLLNIICAFWFSIQLLCETFLTVFIEILSRIYISIHVKYPFFLSDFNESWIFSVDFQKNSQVKFHENLSSGSWVFHVEGRRDRQTDMTRLTFPFHNFMNVSKNDTDDKMWSSKGIAY